MPDPAVQAEAQTLLERGAGLYEAGKLYEALACWKQVLDLDPGNEIATEYLRFIEDNFQIGVDAFMAQHQAVSAPPPPPPPVAQPSAGFAEEALGDLDWSEILEDPEQGSLPPKGSAPVAVADLEEDDEDFFSELEPGSISAEPGGEATAWAADSSLPSEAPPPPAYDPPALDGDPLAMDVSAFSAPVAATAAFDSTPAAPVGAPLRRTDRDLAQMSDDSIEVMLDEDFKAWEEEDLTEASPALEAAPLARPTGAHSATVDEDADFFARPFEQATPPPLPAPSPDDSLDIGHPAPEAIDFDRPALRTPPPVRVAEVLKTPPPAQISAPPPDPDEMPFDMASEVPPPGDSVEIPLDGMLEAAQAEERAEGHTRREDGEDPFAALEEAFSSLSIEVSEAEQVFDELHEAVASSRPPSPRPPERTGAQPPRIPDGAGGPINFDEPLAPAGVASDSLEYLEDADHSLPEVDFAAVEAALTEGEPAPPFVDPDDEDPLPDFDLGATPLAPAAFDLGEDEGPVDFELDGGLGDDFDLDSVPGEALGLGADALSDDELGDGPGADFELDSDPAGAFELDDEPMPVDFDRDDDVDFVLEGAEDGPPQATPPP
ncbi:MAG: tetratricopeptide repeat protein, partial [Myxococcales bacterium]|nr:tetratricopeptide repeat protein [Myxococcales bacterium]